jgi:hypothetical protein
MSDESKKLMSKSSKGIKYNLTEEAREKKSKRMTGENNPMFGRTKELNPFYGKKHSEETKNKISKSNSGYKHIFYGKKRPEYSLKISGVNNHNYGKKNDIISEINKQRIGLKNPRSIVVLDLNCGVYYYSIKDYCVVNKVNISTIRYRIKNNLIPEIILC